MDMPQRPVFGGMLFILVMLSEILGTLAGYPGSAALLGSFLLLLYLKLRKWDARDMKTLLSGFVIGGAWEGLAVHLEWLSYEGAEGHHSIPWWMLIAWMNLGLLLDGVLEKLKAHPVQSFLIGSCAGPLFVMGGEQIGLLVIHDSTRHLQWIALGWGLCFATLAFVTRQFSPPLTRPNHPKL